MANSIQAHPGDWDPTQFKLQRDGTFRISIRGMAAMAGVDQSSLGRSLKSAKAENPLPCARSLVAQGFSPEAVSTWGETGGIPEAAAPFILEHYGITAASPSAQARAVLLAFSRVGINAYLKERLGVSQVRDTRPALVDPAFAASLEVAKLLASAVELVGGNPQHSMARSLTVTGRSYPQFKELCFESQRLLNPGAEEFTNASGLLAELERLLGVEKVRLLARMAKENGWLSKADPRHLVNALLTRAGLQFKGGMRRDQASYIPTAEGAKLSREETRPDIQGSEAWIPQLLWLKEDTVKRLLSFIKDAVPTLSSVNN